MSNITTQPTNVIACLIALSFSTSVRADDGPPSYRHLKPVEKIVGSWQARFDPPGDVPAGELTIRFRWMGNKSYLLSEVLFRPNGTESQVPINPEFTVIGFDSDELTTKAWHFKYLAQGRTDATIARDRLVIEQQQGSEGDEGYRFEKKTYKLEDADQLVITTVSKSAGEPSREDPPLTLTRVK